MKFSEKLLILLKKNFKEKKIFKKRIATIVEEGKMKCSNFGKQPILSDQGCNKWAVPLNQKSS